MCDQCKDIKIQYCISYNSNTNIIVNNYTEQIINN